MFREMRLKEQQLSQAETVEIIENATHGTLAINGVNNYPYSVPVSYVYDDGKIFFHGAVAGQKYDLLTENGHVSISMVDFDDVQPSGYTTFYKSVIAYGDVRRLEDPTEIKAAMELTFKKFCKGYEDGGMKFFDSQIGNFCVYEMNIKHMTGKRSE